MDPVTPKIRLRNLRKSFGSKVVLDGIDLDVMPHTSMVVIGGSGTRKSGLLKCILGLIPPGDGGGEIDCRDILHLPRTERGAVRARIGMLFPKRALFDRLPVWANVSVPWATASDIWSSASFDRFVMLSQAWW